MFSKSSGQLLYASIGWNPSTLDFVTIFVRSKGDFESMYLTDLFFCKCYWNVKTSQRNFHRKNWLGYNK